MKLFLLIGILLGSVASGQGAGPPEVVKSAISAVEDLGREVVSGEYQVAVDRMYPKWKERMAMRKGGIEALERELSSIGEVMARNGVSLIAFKPEGAPKVYEVGPGDSSEEAEGVTNYKKWLVLIPTVTQFRMMQGDNPRNRVINSHGFQVAISDKDKLDWTFINGSDVSVSDLRSLFITLPGNMELPEVKREEAK